MFRTLRTTTYALFLIGATVLAPMATAQTDDASNANLRFNFTLPGARSLAMGGAFVGLADDATAAYSNPAGLVRVSDAMRRAGKTFELSISGGAYQNELRMPDLGRVNGNPLNMGLDSLDPRRFTFSSEGTAGIDFASALFTLGKVSLAAHYTTLARIDFRFAGRGGFGIVNGESLPLNAADLQLIDQFKAQGTDLCGPVTTNADGESSASGCHVRLDPYSAQGQFRMQNYGVSAAFRASSSITVGGGASIYQMSFGDGTRYRRFFVEPPKQLRPTPLYFVENTFSETDPTRLFPDGCLFEGQGGIEGDTCGLETRDQSQQREGGSGVGFNVGLQWAASDSLTFGAVYRHGPTIDYEVRYRENGIAGATAGRTDSQVPILDECKAQFGGVCNEDVGTAEFRMPHTFAAGLAYRASERWLFTLDYQFVGYSRLVGDNEFNATIGLVQPVDANDFHASDAHQVHIGTEYAVAPGSSTPVFVRLGFWNDPDSTINYEQSSSNFTLAQLNKEYLWQEGEDLYHITGGFGFATRNGFQTDFAVDWSSRSFIGRLSTLFRF